MTASQSTTKPDRPYPEYPLFPASNGQWAKKHKGKRYNCGTWDDPTGALEKWLKIREQLEVGLDPVVHADRVSIGDAVNAFLDAKDAKVDAGDLSTRMFDQYKEVCEWLIEKFGRHRPVESLRVQDFANLRAAFPKTWGTKSIENRVMRTRTIFKWMYDAELIDRPVRYSDAFGKPSKKRQRLERRTKQAKEFTAEEIHAIKAVSSDQLAAMILLGLNAGYGNMDCARLRWSDVRGEWLDVPRGKTGEARKAWLWPETRQALAVVKAEQDARREGGRFRPKPGCEGLVFLTHHGREWVSETCNRNAVSIEFRKAKIAAECHRTGVSFYALRHTFETVAGETADQVAVNHVMGHVDDSMAGVYREGVSDERVRRVCEHVRGWFFEGSKKRKRATK